MRFFELMVLAALLFLISSCAAVPVESPVAGRIIKYFDSDWCFFKGDAEGAEEPSFNDDSWRRLNVPHDWSIEGPVDQDNPTGRGGAFMPSGIGWYRKHFTLPAEYKAKRIFIEFDGVMANSDVWINGYLLGKRSFGYVSFRYEMTKHLKFGQNKANVLAVRSNTSAQPASRWYTGAGIYRHVRLVATDPVNIAHWGVNITTPKVEKTQAVVNVKTTVINQSDRQREVTLQTVILSPLGQTINTAQAIRTIEAGLSIDFEQDIIVANPRLWSIDSPNLYKALNKVIIEEKTADDKITRFGIRQFRFDAETGFWLNGKNMKIKGVCLHHDCGALGAAVPKRAWERRLMLLKQIGANGIRTAHNPMSPEFLDVCDELGFVVMDEVLDNWTVGKNHAKYGYHRIFRDCWQADTRDTVLRDRNHPGIIMYSAGNEIRDDLTSQSSFDIFNEMKNIFHELDPDALVTMGVFRPNQYKVYDSGFSELMDVVGQNYRENELIAAHRDKPTRKVIGTENGHSRKAWLVLRDNPFMAGQFLWTGIDYLGESDWPNIAWSNAPIDRTGTIRPMGYQRKSWWSDEPMVHIARYEAASGGVGGRVGAREIVSNWTPRDYDTYDEARIEIYSNCQEVELFLNDKSLGSKPVPDDALPCTWTLTFQKGTIKAVGKNDGKIVAAHELKTADEPAKIVLSSDRMQLTPDFDDVAYITVYVTDINGVHNPLADDLVTFEIEGPGEIVAVDSGDTSSHQSFHSTQRRLYQGQCIAVIRASETNGAIKITATAPSLEPASVTIKTLK